MGWDGRWDGGGGGWRTSEASTDFQYMLWVRATQLGILLANSRPLVVFILLNNIVFTGYAFVINHCKIAYTDWYGGCSCFENTSIYINRNSN